MDSTKLYLVLQDEGVLNYVKYPSHFTPSSRFDINGVFEFYYMKSNDQYDDDNWMMKIAKVMVAMAAMNSDK